MTSITSKSTSAARFAAALPGLVTALWEAVAASVMDGELSLRLKQDAGLAGHQDGNGCAEDLGREMMRRSF
jgi:hypothetical protein